MTTFKNEEGLSGWLGVKCLLRLCGDVSSDPQSPGKKLGVAGHAYTLEQGG